jgi:hypothetical protein
MTSGDVKDILAWLDGDILLADGFDEAIIGYAHVQSEAVAVYDSSICIKILMEAHGMEFQDAVEFFEFNVLGAYLGEKTPLFVNVLRAEDEDDKSS